MRHARPEDLEAIASLLDDLRGIEGLRERSPGTFYRGSHAFLHFHADPTGMFADLKVDGEFVRSRVTTAQEQGALLVAARRAAS